MRELTLFKKINHSYKSLNLKYSKFLLALFFMFLTSILEMSGLSILYPLVLIMSGQSQYHFFSGFKNDLSPLNQSLILFSTVAFLFIAKNIALYFTYNNNINFVMYYYKNLIRGLYRAYVEKPMIDFRKESVGSLANIICVQSGRLIDGVLRPLLVVITEAFILLGISSLLFFISPGLMVAVILMCGGTMGLFYAFFRTKALKWGKEEMQAAVTLQELVSNTSNGISEIKIFAKESYLTSKIYEAATTKARMFHHLEMYQQGPRFIIETVFIVTVVVFFIVLLSLGTAPAILLAQFSVIAAASFRILPSINRLVNSYSNFSFNLGPALALLETFSDVNFSSEPKIAKRPISFEKISVEMIEFKNVTFKYPLAIKPVLENININIQKGQRIGIVGPSGSGKSTFIELLAGLYAPLLGEISVDGLSILESLKAWQSSIGYVPQVAFIMPGSIKENIIFGSNILHQDTEIWKALQTVGLEKMISMLPEGIETNIGEKGIILSGGQKQLICMARTLFRNPEVFLLDEPTASLDAQNEAIVLQAINNLPPGKIIVMVSHKKENFSEFDIIYVCEKGKIRAEKSVREEYLMHGDYN